MKIFFHTKSGAVYITKENYNSIKATPPSLCHLISNGGEFPLLFFTAINRHPVCTIYLGSKASGTDIQLPATYSLFLKEVGEVFKDISGDATFISDSLCCTLNHRNYLNTYLKVSYENAKKEGGHADSYDSIEIISPYDDSSSECGSFLESSSEELSGELSFLEAYKSLDF
ncbi:MAG: hypothetical protein GY915_07180 [bacterium]|nr:hypothetical protein [bacterium]